MKLKLGTKLNVILTDAPLITLKALKKHRKTETAVPCEGELVVHELAADGSIQHANFFPDGGTTFFPVDEPKFKLIRKRKEYREIRVIDKQAPHGVSQNLRVRVWPNGAIEVVEARRRSGYFTTAATLYTQLIFRSLQKPKKRLLGRN